MGGHHRANFSYGPKDAPENSICFDTKRIRLKNYLDFKIIFRAFSDGQSKAARSLHVHTITNAKSKKDHDDTVQARFQKC